MGMLDVSEITGKIPLLERESIKRPSAAYRRSHLDQFYHSLSNEGILIGYL